MISTPVTAGLVRGAIGLEPTAGGLLPHRLPAWARAQYSDPQVSMVESPSAAGLEADHCDPHERVCTLAVQIRFG